MSDNWDRRRLPGCGFGLQRRLGCSMCWFGNRNLSLARWLRGCWGRRSRRDVVLGLGILFFSVSLIPSTSLQQS